MNRRGLMVAALSSLCLQACGKVNEFEVEWDEEVQLVDGSTLVAHIKYIYERRSMSSGYTGAILRNTEISFRTPDRKEIHQRFIRQRPLRLDKSNGEWTIIIEQLSGMAGAESGQDWGVNVNMNGQRVIVWRDDRFYSESFNRLLDRQLTSNLMIWLGEVGGLVDLSGKHITLDKKRDILLAHPLDVSHRDIYRPNI